MNVPAIFTTLTATGLLSGTSLALLTILSGLLVFAVPRWWGVTTFLFLEFIGLGLLLYPLYAAHVAFTVWLAGLFGAAVLAVTGRQLGPAADRALALPPSPAGLLWRIGQPALILLLTWAIVRWTPLQVAGSPAVTWTVLALFLIAAGQFIRPQPPLLLGAALITGLAALGLWQAATLTSPLLVGFWAVMTILTTLLTAFLMKSSNP